MHFKGLWSPRTEISDSLELHRGHLELKLGSLQEQSVLLTTDSLPQFLPEIPEVFKSKSLALLWEEGRDARKEVWVCVFYMITLTRGRPARVRQRNAV